MPARRKSTDYHRRRNVPDLDGEQTERRISPQERRRQIMIHAGVWFLVVVFAMTSGVMCFNMGGEEQNPQAAQPAQQDELQVEIDRWAREVGTSPSDPVALANLGHYWRLKAESSPSEGALAATPPAPSGSPQASPGSPQPSPTPQMTREQAWTHAEEYLGRAIKSDPNYAFALQEMAELRIDQKRGPEARTLLEKILALPDEPIQAGQDATTIMANRTNRKSMALKGMVRLEAAEKNYDQALIRLEQLQAVDPGNQDVYGMRAQVLEEQGSLDQALKAYDEVISVGQGMQDQGMVLGARLRRAQIFLKQQDKTAARAELEQARTVAQSSGQPQAIMLVNYFLYQLDGAGPTAPPMGLPTGPSPAAGSAQPAPAPPAAGGTVAPEAAATPEAPAATPAGPGAQPPVPAPQEGATTAPAPVGQEATPLAPSQPAAPVTAPASQTTP